MLPASAAWDRPLILARDLAPGNDKPRHFIVITAYLDKLWSSLSAEKRQTAQDLLEKDGRSSTRPPSPA